MDARCVRLILRGGREKRRAQRRRRRERARVRTGRGMCFEKARQVHVRFVPFRSLTRGVSDDGRDVRRTWERFEESIDTSLGRGTDSRMNANTTLVRRFTAPERMVKSSVRTSQRSVSRAKSRGAKSRTAICTLKNAEGSQSGLLEIFLKIYFPKTSYEYFDSSWKKNRGKSCTPHSRVSKLCRLRLLSDRITALRERGVWEPTKPGLRVLVCAASGDSKVLEDTSRRPERSRPPFRGRERERRHTRASIGGGTRFVTPRVSTNGTPARVFTAGRAIRGEA